MSKLRANLEIVALLSQIVAALGVIASLVYLATEVRATNSALKAQSHFTTLSLFNQHLILGVENDRVADIVYRGDLEPGALTEAEWRRYADFMLVAVNTWEYGYYLNEDGAVPAQLWEGGDASYREWARSAPGAKKFWLERRSVFADPFGSYANQFFSENQFTP